MDTDIVISVHFLGAIFNRVADNLHLLSEFDDLEQERICRIAGTTNFHNLELLVDCLLLLHSK